MNLYQVQTTRQMSTEGKYVIAKDVGEAAEKYRKSFQPKSTAEIPHPAPTIGFIRLIAEVDDIIL